MSGLPPGEMVSGIKDIPYTFRGRKTVLKGIHGLYIGPLRREHHE